MLSRDRVRPWLDGARPDAVAAIDTARDYGWIECTYTDPEFQGLNRLVANVVSGGSITERDYEPGFALTDDSDVTDALEHAGVDSQLVTDRDGRADEVRPTDDGSVLGRVLAVLGAPVGPKADQHLSLPDHLEGAPADIRAAFVDAYLANRAIEHAGKETLPIREVRTRDDLAALTDLLADVADADIELGQRDSVISADAARVFGLAD